MAKSLPQCNPTLDKMAVRLGLAGAGYLGATLKDLAGTINITVEADEDLSAVRIYSADNEYDLLAGGSWQSLGEGRRLWTRDIVYGTETDYGPSGGNATRNSLEWTISKKVVENPEDEPDSYLKDRDFFDTDRDFSLADSASTSRGSADRATGVTWRDDQKHAYIVHRTGWIQVVDEEGTYQQDDIQLPGSLGFDNAQGIAYLGSDRFAVVNRGSLLGDPAKLLLFHLVPGQTTVDSADVRVYSLDDVTLFASGGVTGLAYDAANDVFYVGTEPTGSGEGGLWRVDLNTRDTDGKASQELLFSWYDVLVAPGHIGGTSELGGLFFSSSLANGQVNNSVFACFYAVGAFKVVQVALDVTDGGEWVSEFSPALTGEISGLTMDVLTEKLFFVRTLPVSPNFWRYEHTGYEEDYVFRQQFYCKDLPLKGGIYLAGQEAQLGEAICFVNESDANPMARDSTFGINILPTFNDEFFRQHEFSGNRYAQTIRNWGGAATVEFFIDEETDPVIAEMDIADLAGYYWVAPDWGLHTVTARIRAETGSEHYVDIVGYIRFKQFECP